MKTSHVIVIGAGIGGLTTAALLVKAGFKVTVLEAHVYPGGSAGTFTHQGYHFDAGATLVGGFNPGGPHHQIQESLGINFPVQDVDPAWVTTIDGKAIFQWQNREQWRDEILGHFPESARFWKKQEDLANLAWRLSSNYFPFPPQNIKEGVDLAAAFRPDWIQAAPYFFAKVSDLLPRKHSALLKPFLDAQLMISAQSTSSRTNVLYGSAALDLPRRGVKYVQGGIGTLSKMLADWIRQNGGQVLYRQQVNRIITKNQTVMAVETKKGLTLQGDLFVANLTPGGLKKINQAGEQESGPLTTKPSQASWGAFMLYLGADSSVVPSGMAYHQQVIVNPVKPLGEGNSVFISISPDDDDLRAPRGKTAITVSTHTNVQQWWNLANENPDAYAERKADYSEMVLQAVENVLPDIRQKASLILLGTPVTFQFYTNRPKGLVGGTPQESLLNVKGPGTGFKNLWMVGDSIFPGQSTAAVTIGAQRVARMVKSASRKA